MLLFHLAVCAVAVLNTAAGAQRLPCFATQCRYSMDPDYMATKRDSVLETKETKLPTPLKSVNEKEQEAEIIYKKVKRQPVLQDLTNEIECPPGYEDIYKTLPVCLRLRHRKVKTVYRKPYIIPSNMLFQLRDTFGHRFVDLVNNRSCQAMTRIAIPAAYSTIELSLRDPETHTMIQMLQDEIAQFMEFPAIYSRWRFIDKQLKTLPVIGTAIRELELAKISRSFNALPDFVKDKIGACIGIHMTLPPKDPFFFILGTALNMTEHPTIIRRLMSFLEVKLMSISAEIILEAIRLAEHAEKLAEVAIRSGLLEDAKKVNNVARKVGILVTRMSGTKFDAKAAEAVWRALKAASSAYKAVENAGNRETHALMDITTTIVPHVHQNE